jgi:hypothetical protein
MGACFGKYTWGKDSSFCLPTPSPQPTETACHLVIWKGTGSWARRRTYGSVSEFQVSWGLTLCIYSTHSCYLRPLANVPIFGRHHHFKVTLTMLERSCYPPKTSCVWQWAGQTWNMFLINSNTGSYFNYSREAVRHRLVQGNAKRTGVHLH